MIFVKIKRKNELLPSFKMKTEKLIIIVKFITELDSYAKVVSALRAQGSLNDPKRKILSDLRDTFHITTDRHKAEVRRAVNDEKLTTVAEV